MRIFSTLLITLLLIFTISCNRAKVAAERDIAKGIQFMKSGQYLEAGVRFKEAIKQDPKTVKGHYYFALLRVKQEKYPEAVKLLTKTLSLDPAYEEAAVYLGYVFILQKQYDAAIKVLKPFTAESKNAQVFFYMGKAFYDKKDYEEAIKWFQKTLLANPNHKETFALLGDAFIRSDNVEKAQKILSSAAKYSDDPVVLSKLGTVLFQIGNNIYLEEKKASDAVNDMKTSLKKVKKSKKYKAKREKIKLEIEEKEKLAMEKKIKKEGILSEAKKYFKKALKNNPSHKEALYNLSMTHYLLKEYVDSRDIIKRFIQVNPTGQISKQARAQLDQLEEIIQYEEQKKLDNQK